MFFFYLGIVLLITLIALSPRTWATVVYVGMVFGLLYLGFADTLGRDRPVTIDFFQNEEEVIVLYANPQKEQEKIYLLLKFKDKILYYSVPWTKKLEKELKEQGQKANKLGLPLMFNLLEDFDIQPGNKKFYPYPQPRSPLEKVIE